MALATSSSTNALTGKLLQDQEITRERENAREHQCSFGDDSDAVSCGFREAARGKFDSKSVEDIDLAWCASPV